MPKNVYTVCFCGTACSRDEGEETRNWDYKLLKWVGLKDQHVYSDRNIYAPETGYIPVRLHTEISTGLRDTTNSVTVRGVGENDWCNQMDGCDALDDRLGNAPGDLRGYARTYSEGNQRTLTSQFLGWSDAALALHGASLAAGSKAEQYNFIGHSRGAVESIMAAWFLYAYGGEDIRNIPINIFAIDPVPGPGQWYGIQTQLPPNVVNYVGVYAWDHLTQGFNALIPRPNARMTRQPGHVAIENRGLGSTWSTLADNRQLDDPLVDGGLPQPEGYSLYACRGRHGTVAGNTTSDGQYAASKVNADVSAVPKLVYKLARAYLTRWETTFRTRCRVRESARQLRKAIHTAHSHFDAMAGGETRTSRMSGRPSVRQVSSTLGRLAWKTSYLEDVVGTPPYSLAYPCTIEQSGGGWVKWKFL
ncbi:Tat pathway signal protein [Corallococcus terminator]